MKYLLYYFDGFIKKFPLRGTEISIGRKKENDLSLDLESISREHVKILMGDDIVIRDMNSTNGTFVRNVRITEKRVEVGESFNIGGLEFFIREGSLEEFKTADELKPIFNAINASQSQVNEDDDTKYINDIFADILQYIAKTGFRKRSFNHFIHDLSDYLSQLQNFGSISLISRDNGSHNVFFTIERLDNLLSHVNELLEKDQGIFTDMRSDTTFPGTKHRFYSFPLELGMTKAVMIYVPMTPAAEESDIVLEFLDLLSKEISLLSRILLNGHSPSEAGRDVPEGPEPEPVKIVAVDPGIKKLIEQTRKIASSEVFVLIEGESGTGKELFARLLHRHSKRSRGPFVAINCAAIPETLLESELFGYEKGAFTGAYARKKGKLEAASGGTLVLDEIGDMPIQLQAKILRVLQESEFYRLGGTAPIKVDLRIVSLTNQDLKKLISENAFREDLFYRLVHHRITIPPLRERKEDISPLISHFTGAFAQELGKNISGYTVQVFKAMGNYSWPGNVRQLENEVRRLVNLVEPGESIHYDLLSEELIRGDQVREKEEKQGSGIYGKFGSERDYIIHLLDTNKWNKSRTAQDLGITYQGLHKKMKRLGIVKQSSRGSEKKP